MDIRKKLLPLLALIVAISTVAATQYATSDIGYTFDIVSGTDANVRFIGHDQGQDNVLVLRADDASGSNLGLELGDYSRDQTSWYTSAFGIVNEEILVMNITGISVSGSGANYMYIYLHNNSNTKAEDDTNGLLIWNGISGAVDFTWQLAAGDNDATDMGGQSGDLATPVDSSSYVRALTNPEDDDDAEDTDHVWVQIKLVIPAGASTGTYSGDITFEFAV